ncbi:hypothetical protein CASFOL_037591 [Castilleja foliolosa]|uniref:Uncharacterized protein n=1 Tax=Castilleja foliolosa TaxID=1961234 RepID=A0ABD3BML8_9LAMI
MGCVRGDFVYKRVGSIIHNGDCRCGIIGVIDVIYVMDDSNGHVWVHSNKQGFQDYEAYPELEKWFGEKVAEYLDNNVDKTQVIILIDCDLEAGDHY